MIRGHGGNIHELADELGCRPSEITDMSSNMNPLGPPPGLVDHLKNHLEAINSLPEADAKSSIHAFAERYDIDPKRVLAGNGTTQFIYSLPPALRINRALIIGPTYSDYADACAMHGVPYNFLLAEGSKDFVPEFTDIDRHLNGIDTAFICNSNNPTGVTIPLDTLDALCRSRPGIRWIIDESYLPFADSGNSISMLFRYLPNVVVLSSLSKIFRIPGLRIGFLSGSEKTTQSLARYALPWNVNSLSQIAVDFLMKNIAEVDLFIKDTNDFLAQERKSFQDALKRSSGADIYPSTTSFFLIKLPTDITAADICRHFAQKRILLRDCSNFRGLSNRFIRISLKSSAINQQVAGMLLEYLEGQGR